MIKKGKKVKSRSALFALGLLLLAACSSFFCFAEKSDANDFSRGIYSYRFDGSFAVITAVDKSVSGNVSVPSKLGFATVSAIEKEAFKDCNSIKSVVIPETVKSIRDRAFYGCESLEKVRFLSESVSFGNGVFENCTSLSDVILPKETETVPKRMFFGCTALESFSFPKELFSIGAEAFEKSGIKSLELPTSLFSVGERAFSFCPLTELKIPEKVGIIGEEAFAFCSLNGVIITSLPTVIEKNAFQKNSNGVSAVFFGFDKTGVKDYAEENGFAFEEIGCRHFQESFEFTERIEPTCTENGQQTGVYCNECKAFVAGAKDIEALGHTVVSAPGTESTCTKPGVSEKKFCSRCGEVFEEPSPLPLKPHKKIAAVTKKATAASNGIREERCSVCKTVLKRTPIKKIELIYLSKTAFTFNKKVHTPSVIVTDSEGNNLKKGKDFTVSYSSGRKETGKYFAVVKFKGDYAGEKKLFFTVLPPKTAKLSLKVDQKAAEISASWKKVPGATGYRVYLFLDKTFVKSTDTLKTSATFKNLSRGAKYKLVVRAYKKEGKEKLFSTYSAGESFLTKPAAPSLKAKASGKNTAFLRWNEQKYVTGYAVYMSTGNGYKKVGVVKDKTSFTVKNLKSGRTYYFKIRSFKKASGVGTIYSGYSSIVSVKL